MILTTSLTPALKPWTPALHCQPRTGAPQSREVPCSLGRAQNPGPRPPRVTKLAHVASLTCSCFSGGTTSRCRARLCSRNRQVYMLSSSADATWSWVSWRKSLILAEVSSPHRVLRMRTVITSIQSYYEDPVIKEEMAQGRLAYIWMPPLSAGILLFVHQAAETFPEISLGCFI